MSERQFDKSLRERIDTAAKPQGFRLLTLKMCHRHFAKFGPNVPIECCLRQLTQNEHGEIGLFQGDFSPAIKIRSDEDEDDKDMNGVTISLDGRLVLMKSLNNHIELAELGLPFYPDGYEVVEISGWLAENDVLPKDKPDYDFSLGGLIDPNESGVEDMDFIDLDFEGDPMESGCNMFVESKNWNGNEPIEK